MGNGTIRTNRTNRTDGSEGSAQLFRSCVGSIVEWVVNAQIFCGFEFCLFFVGAGAAGPFFFGDAEVDAGAFGDVVPVAGEGAEVVRLKC